MSTQERRTDERRAEPRRGITAGWDAFYTLLRWIGRHVQGFHAAVGTFLVVGLVIALLAVGFFALLAEWMAEGATQAFDDSVLLWLNAHATEWLNVAALEVTALGAGLVVWMIVLISSAFLWLSRHRYSVLLLWVAVAGGGLLNIALKAAFDRPRPQLFEWRAEYAGMSSFPSGHSMTAVVAYGTLAYLVARLGPTPLLRRLTLGVAGLVIVLIGLSRLYLGVHYPSDVIAGFVAGLAWAAVCALGIEAIRHFRQKKPEVAAEEKDLEHRLDLEGRQQQQREARE